MLMGMPCMKVAPGNSGKGQRNKQHDDEGLKQGAEGKGDDQNDEEEHS
jgi:hypothetical protein